jgi:[protein-PII] uridylyltransferase
VLHRITKAIADLGLDIRHARVLTLGHEVVDSFYVRQQNGEQITDKDYKDEISRAVLYVLGEQSR